MQVPDAKNAVLVNIKSAIDDAIRAENQTIGSLAMTDKLRRMILTILVRYSDHIPHPASGSGAVSSAENVISEGDTTNAQNNKQASKPNQSNTLIRWQVLAYVSSLDLTLAKWFESHLDALSILHEVGYDKAPQGLWAVWAAEGHPDPIRHTEGKISGSKAWCSGANLVDYGLMTYRDEQGQAQLLMVDMHQSGIDIDNDAWQAVGMQATDTATIQFHEVDAINVGAPNAYLERVGFWHGAAGVAACWYGAAARIANYLITAYQHKPNDYKAIYLGQISTALAVTQQYFYHIADLIEGEPLQNHELAIRQLRANVEQVARQVMEKVGQALGAAPFCGNAHFARLTADLAVFIRQSHGAFDLQKIGELSSAFDRATNSDSTDRQDNIWQL